MSHCGSVEWALQPEITWLAVLTTMHVIKLQVVSGHTPCHQIFKYIDVMIFCTI